MRGARLVVLAAAALGLALASVLVHDAGAATSQHARVEGSNPNLGQRLIYLERWIKAHGGKLPELVVIGSSRSTYYDPQQLEQLTGATAFNAGISDGGAAAYDAMVQWLELRSGGQLPGLLIFADLETFDGRTTHVRTRIWQQRMDDAIVTCPSSGDAACVQQWTSLARSLANEATKRQGGAPGWQRYQRSDGRQVGGALAEAKAKGADLDALRQRRIQVRIGTYGKPGGFYRVDPEAREHFDDVLGIANHAGVRPLVVLTPTHPDCIRICGRAGWSKRHTEVRAALRELAEERDFRLVDFSNPKSYGGSGAEFFDEIHLQPQGAARVIRVLDQRKLLDPLVETRTAAAMFTVGADDDAADSVTDLARQVATVFTASPASS